ncbi:MAG TPA: hypothetical protein VN673_09985, partial [Clostridia bacterium]|nr:hypothetical protein [Clostridia bacterium]
MSKPILEDGAVVYSGKRIISVKPWRRLGAEEQRRAIDLGDVLVLPGLVNTHCHLDYTDLAGHFLPPKVFTDWLRAITEEKAGWDIADYVSSWTRGAQMLLRTGTTTVGDIEAV